MSAFKYSETFNEVLKSGCDELVAGVVEMEAVGGVLCRDLGIVGIESELVIEVENGDIELLCGLVKDEYTIDEKMLLVAEKVDAAGEHRGCHRFAVNDVVISHDSYLGISYIKVENERGDQVCYAADGVILSTPAGSTAYSLSAGGPIISHGLDSITVTPICPHSFFNRSIVYSADECIRVSNISDAPLNISIDGRFFDRLNGGDACTIYKSDRRIKMLSFGNTNLFSTLSKKIKHLQGLV